jgi:hypothetical protein
MASSLDQPRKASAYETVLRTEMQQLQNLGGQRHPLQRVFIWITVSVSLVTFGWTLVNTIPQWPSLLLWVFTQFNLNIPDYFVNGGLRDTLFPFTLLFPLCVMIWDLWLMVRTLVISTNSIARERNAKSWELLLLTSVNTRQVIKAKWWAVVRHQRKDYALLAVMRIGMVGFLALNFSVTFSFGDFPYFSYGSPGPLVEPDRTIVFFIATLIVLLSAAIIAMLTMLNLKFTAACGILGGFIALRPSLALPSGIAVRLLLAIILAALIGIPSYLGLKPDIETSIYYPDPVLSTIFLILGLMGSSMVDNGSMAAGLLVRFGYNVRWYSTFRGFRIFSDTLRGHGPAFLIALLLSILIYVVLTRILLRQSEKMITRQCAE